MRVGFFSALSAIILMFADAAAADQIANLKFSAPEVQLLKHLDQIEKGAGISSSMLKAAPFVSLFGSPSPTDVAITITTNDWDLIVGSLGGLRKIEACKREGGI
jgi:hypothetical protein